MARVLLVIPTLDRSGAEKQFALLATGLKQRGHQIEVVALSRGGPYQAPLEAAEIPVTILGKKARFDLSAVLKLRRLIQARQPDVVLSYLFAGNAAARLAVLGIRRNRPRVLISERCVDTWKSGWQLWLDRRLRSSTDLLIANSESVADFYKAQRFPADKIEVIPNGVEIPPQPTLSKVEFCREIELPADAQLIAFIGRLAPQKRIKDLLWAMQMLRHTCPNAYFLIIGNGPLREQLEHDARNCEADSNTRFLGHREDAASLLHLIDVFWLASEFEGMSNSLMEAMACGVPAVVSDIPPNRELIRHGVDGWLVNLGDGAGFTQYTVRLLQDPESAKALGQSAAKRMREDFSIQKMIDHYHRLISDASD